jgi:DNA-binding LacI/PurR family transcriptional regulator
VGRRQTIKKTTIADIADASGVSVSTVSRILNNKPDVAEETRQRVLQVIEEHRFAPQIAWQQLRSGKSRFIALHFPQDFNPPSHEIITGAALGCESAGYSLNLIASSLNDNDLLAVYRSGQADGMILMEILTHDPRVELLRQHELPFVMIGRCADNTGLSYVDLDIGAGVTGAIGHLFELGHRHIGFVTLAPVLQEKEYGYATWALRGYERACQRLGLPIRWRAADLKSNDIAAVVLSLLDEDPQITAIVTPQEAGLPGVLGAVQARSLRIPDDISIVGLISGSIAELTTPPLTTISFPSRDMGYEAAKILIAHLTGASTSAQQILLRPELCVRGSTGPVRTEVQSHSIGIESRNRETTRIGSSGSR